MFELLQMWALVEVLGFICLPLTTTVFHNLPDRGWAFSKAIGVALLAFCVWLPLMYFHSLPFSQLFIAGVLLIVVAFNLIGFVRVRRSILKLVHLNFMYIMASELVFLGMIFLLGWIRSYGPDIRSFEMFMDEGFLAAIMRSPHFPPNDMWFSGYAINYYYYAHYTIATLAKLLGQPPSIAFNTGICMFYGLTAVSLFGVTCNVVALAQHRRAGARSGRSVINHTPTTNQVQTTNQAPAERPDTAHPSLVRAIPYALLTMLMALVLGNLAATQQWFQLHGDLSQFDWFYQPTRVVDRTINEFPAFSFLLSCFHAHVLALAFTIVAIALALNLFLEHDGKGIFVYGRGWRLPLTLAITALILGGLFTMNGWDFPTYLGLTLVCIALQQWLAHGSRFNAELVLDVFVAGANVAALSFLLYLPFYVTFISPAQGLGIVSPADRSPLHEEVLIYGMFAFIFLSLLVAVALRGRLFAQQVETGPATDRTTAHGRRPGDNLALPLLGNLGRMRTGVVLLLLLIAVELLVLAILRNSTTFVIASAITALGVASVLYQVRDRSLAFVLLLGTVAFALVAGCEILFLKDVFADNFPRMNTVFKFYFQAWAMLSITSGAGIYFIRESFRPAGQPASIRPGERVGARNAVGARFIAPWGGGARFLAGPPLAGAQSPSTSLAVSQLAEPASGVQFGLQRLVGVLWGMLLLALLVASAAFPLAGSYARTNHFLQRINSLDGLAYMQNYDPPDYWAIRWLNSHVSGDPVIVEAIGPDYTDYARISAFTGLPTPMGWIGHEYQWRVNWLNNNNGLNAFEFSRRAGDIDSIYTDPHPAVVLTLLARYHAQYLYVGPLEEEKYPKVNLHRFSTFMKIVYSADGVTIYSVG